MLADELVEGQATVPIRLSLTESKPLLNPGFTFCVY